MKKAWIAGVLAILVVTGMPQARAVAGGVAFSASDLYAMCTSSYDVDYGYCAGYVSAVANVLSSKGSVGGYTSCHNQNVRSQQFVDTFNSFAEVFPDKMTQNADVVVAAALSRAFPCK